MIQDCRLPSRKIQVKEERGHRSPPHRQASCSVCSREGYMRVERGRKGSHLLLLQTAYFINIGVMYLN